jgi:hypothetical protein
MENILRSINRFQVFLRRHGEEEISLAFESIDGLRAGRFYGRKGNGEIVKRALENLEVIKKWLG